MDQNPTLVVDNGSGFMKMGIAGDDAPKAWFPTIVGRPKQPGQMIGMEQKDLYIGHQVTSKQSLLNLSRPIVDGMIENWEDTIKVWHHGFINELQMSPDESPILMTEPPVSSFYLALPQVLALYSTGKTTGVLLGSGYALTSAVPVFEGFALSHAIQKINLGGQQLTDYLISLMKEDGISFSNMKQHAKEKANDTKEKVCFVATDYEGSLKQFTENPSKQINHRLPDGNQITLRSHAFKCPEALFQPSKILGKDVLGAHELTFQSILKCDSDIRKDLYSNITFGGGTTMLKNFRQRIQKQVIALAPSTMKINVFDPPERKYAAWMGGSILASLSSFQPMFVSKQQYLEGGSVKSHMLQSQVQIPAMNTTPANKTSFDKLIDHPHCYLTCPLMVISYSGQGLRKMAMAKKFNPLN